MKKLKHFIITVLIAYLLTALWLGYFPSIIISIIAIFILEIVVWSLHLLVQFILKRRKK